MNIDEIIKIMEEIALDVVGDIDELTVDDCLNLIENSEYIEELLEENYDYLKEVDNDFIKMLMYVYTKEKRLVEQANQDDTVLSAYHQYLNYVMKFKVPTREEEIELLKRIKSGDMEAKKELMLRNQGLVIKVGQNRVKSNRTYDIMSAVQDGNLGLSKAIDCFDIDLSTKLSTYAYPWIFRYIQLGSFNEYSGYIRRIKNDFVYNAFARLDAPIETNKDDAEEVPLIDTFPNYTLNPEKMYFDEELKRELISLIDCTLNDNEKDIIMMHYGLDGREPLTLNEIRRIKHKRQATISQVEKSALLKLQCNGDCLRDYL